jgi:hypothetical protein
MLRRPIIASSLLVLALTTPKTLSAGTEDPASSPTADTETAPAGTAAVLLIDGPAPPDPPEMVARDARGRVTLRAVRLEEPLDIDGKLEEKTYRLVPSVSEFIQQEPAEGEPATEKTEVWVFFDNDNVYVSARAWDSHPERMIANEMRRDNRNIFLNENFAVILDTFYDRRNGFLFQTNPLGGLADAQVTDERNTNSDWNTVWEVKTGRFSEGWTVEMMLPFKSLRYKAGTSQIWGINFRRIVRWKNEWSYLTPISAAYRGRGILRLSSAATLVGIEPPARSKNIELKPYATSGLRTDLSADDPFSNDFNADAGFDAKYGLTRSMVFDFTYNTDFAQVEADEQQVNLTRFGLFFPEKREFFLEGQGIFNFAGRTTRRGGGEQSDMPILFFSRRIGFDEEEVVPIRVGGRVTGRTGKYTIGTLAMQTGGAPSAGVPGTNFGVARVKRDILRRSNIGFITTYRSESLESPGSNTVFGVDGNFSFFQNLDINTYWARSSSPLLAGEDTSYMGRLRYDGDRYGVDLEHLAIGGNFNPEVGFLRREDMRKSYGRVRFSPRPRSIEAIRKFDLVGRFNYITDSEGTLATRVGGLELRTELESGDWFSIQYAKNFEFLDEEFEIADKVILPVRGYSFQEFRYSYRFGPQRPISGWLSFGHGSFFSGTRKQIKYFGRIELSPQLSVEPRISYNWIDLAEGQFTTTLLRIRSDYMFSPRAFLGALIQYNTSNDSLSTNLRFRWEYRPGSDLFVVYSDGRDTLLNGFPQLENRSLVVKFTRLFRL